MLKKGEKKYALEAEAGRILLDHLNAGKPARTAPLDADQLAAVHDWFLLTMKKVIYAANIGEEDIGKSAAELPLVAPGGEDCGGRGRGSAGDLRAGGGRNFSDGAGREEDVPGRPLASAFRVWIVW